MYVCFSLTYIGTYYVQMTLLISNIIAGPCATLNSWTIHCSVCCHIWSPLLPIIAGPFIVYKVHVQWTVQLF